MTNDEFIHATVFGARLCPQDQPQHMNDSPNFRINRLLRLAFGTAALRLRRFQSIRHSSF
jgi:hypothetical protein